MVSFSNLISRNDPEDWLPYESAKYIRQINASPLEDVATQLLKSISPEELLLEEKVRRNLLSALTREECQELLKKLQVKKYDIEHPWENIYTIFKRVDVEKISILYDFLGLDKGFAREFILPSDDKSQMGKSLSEVVGPKKTLFSHQRKALIELEENFFRVEGPRYRALLHMPTGSGKTKTAAMMACRYLLRFDRGLVVWLADTKELCEQAYEELKESWVRHGDRDVVIYRTFDKNKPNLNLINGGIVVASLQTIRGYPNESLLNLTRQEPLVIFDEAHKTTAATYEQVVNTLMSRVPMGTMNRLLGLSATPGRKFEESEENKKLIDLYSGLIVRLKVPGFNSPIEYLMENQYLARPKFVEMHSEFDFAKNCELLGIDVTKRISSRKLNLIYEAIANDPARTALVVSEAIRLVKKQKHKRVIIFAASVEQSRRLSFILRYFGFNASSIDSEVSDIVRDSIIENFKKPQKEDAEPKILCNYQILTTGFDAPEISALIIARPTNSLVLYSQMVGRALRGRRAGGGKDEAEIVTIVDKNRPAFWNVDEAFRHWDEEWKESSM